MPTNHRIIECRDCGFRLDEVKKKLTPCPHCGSRRRQVKITLNGTVHIHSKLGLKARSGKSRKPFLEQQIGDRMEHKSGKWMKIRRVIDRLKDWYSEIVYDPRTGEIIHYSEEPLSRHRGHGSAKHKE